MAPAAPVAPLRAGLPARGRGAACRSAGARRCAAGGGGAGRGDAGLPQLPAWLLALVARAGRGWATQCTEEYGRSAARYASLSGAAAAFWFGEVRLWQAEPSLADVVSPRFAEQLRSHPMWGVEEEPGSPIQWPDRLLQVMHDMAVRQLRACKTEGGRYWEVQLDYSAYMNQILEDTTLGMGARIIAEEDMRLLKANQSIILAMCAPSACGGDELLDALLMFLDQSSPLSLDPHANILRFGSFPRPRPELASVHELGDWDMLSLDFVILGVDRCGTTSLANNLAQHPDIGFADGAWFTDHRFLPRLADVRAFNAQWTDGAARPGFVGLLAYALQRQVAHVVLGGLSRVKVLVITCDPLGRFEKKFFQEAMCHDDLDAALKSGDALLVQRYQSGECVGKSISAALEPLNRVLFDEWAVGPYLRKISRFIHPDRLTVVSQDWIRDAPVLTYQGMVARMGIPPFPWSTRFYRYNSRKGHRTDLCRNASLANALKLRLSDEYRGIRAARDDTQDPVPPSLVRRRSRCDRPAELDDAPGCAGSRCN